MRVMGFSTPRCWWRWPTRPTAPPRVSTSSSCDEVRLVVNVFPVRSIPWDVIRAGVTTTYELGARGELARVLKGGGGHGYRLARARPRRCPGDPAGSQ